jgi:hypothetical protein
LKTFSMKAEIARKKETENRWKDLLANKDIIRPNSLHCYEQYREPELERMNDVLVNK